MKILGIKIKNINWSRVLQVILTTVLVISLIVTPILALASVL